MARYIQRDADFALDVELGDEDLPLPRDLDPPWVQRARRPVAVALVLLTAGVVVLRTTGDETPSKPVAQPTTEPERIHDVSHPIERASSGLVSDDLIDACPAGVTCRTSTELPAAVVAALRGTFPGYTQPSARTVTALDATGARMLGRFVHVVTGGADITVQVLARRLPPSSVLTGSGSAAIVVLQRTVGTATVRVTVCGPAASMQRGSAPARLATDVRLLQP